MTSKHWECLRKHCFGIVLRGGGTGNEHEDCNGTFKKLIRNSEYSKSDNFFERKFQYWPKFLVSYKKYV